MTPIDVTVPPTPPVPPYTPPMVLGGVRIGEVSAILTMLMLVAGFAAQVLGAFKNNTPLPPVPVLPTATPAVLVINTGPPATVSPTPLPLSAK